MRNNNRNSQKPTARNSKTIIENEFDVLLLNTYDGVSLIIYTRDWERDAMRRTFHFQMPDIDVRIKDFLLCVDTGRAMGQCFRRNRGIQIDLEMKKVADGVSILMHIVTLFTDDGYPRYEMQARNEDGTFRMVDGKHVMVPATLTFKRVFPENRLQKLYDKSEDLVAEMLLDRIRRTLRARGDRATLTKLGKTLDFYLEEAEKPPVAPKLTASAGEILAHKEGRNKKGRGQMPKIGDGKAADSPKENAVEQVSASATPVAATAPAADASSFAEVMTPVPVASAVPAPAPKPKTEKPLKLGSPEANAKLAEFAASAPSSGSNGQQK